MKIWAFTLSSPGPQRSKVEIYQFDTFSLVDFLILHPEATTTLNSHLSRTSSIGICLLLNREINGETSLAGGGAPACHHRWYAERHGERAVLHPSRRAWTG